MASSAPEFFPPPCTLGDLAQDKRAWRGMAVWVRWVQGVRPAIVVGVTPTRVRLAWARTSATRGRYQVHSAPVWKRDPLLKGKDKPRRAVAHA